MCACVGISRSLFSFRRRARHKHRINTQKTSSTSSLCVAIRHFCAAAAAASFASFLHQYIRVRIFIVEGCSLWHEGECRLYGTAVYVTGKPNPTISITCYIHQKRIRTQCFFQFFFHSDRPPCRIISHTYYESACATIYHNPIYNNRFRCCYTS